MNEENQTTKVKKSGKAKKIIIAVVAVIVVLAIVIGILIATGKFELNLSKKSKMEAGIEQLGEAFTKPMDLIADAAEKNGTVVKVVDNINKDSAIEASTEMSAKIDSLDIDSLSSSEQKQVDSLVDLINASKLGLDLRYDGNKSAYAKINGNIDGVELSGEGFYDGSQAGFRSEELNTKWITISQSDIEDLLDENGLDIEDIKKVISTTSEQMDEIMKSVEVDEKTQKEIRKRYSDVMKDFIKDKSKKIKSESTKVEVDGKDKKCTKLTLKLDADDIKDIAKEYVETFAKDEQMKEILTKSASAYAKIMEEADPSSSADDISSMIDELYNNIDEIKNEIDNLEFDGTVKLTVYATATKVYRTDIDIDVDDSNISLATTFNKENTEVELSADDTKMATLTIESKKDEVKVKVETSKLIGNMSMELNYKVEDKKSEMKMTINAGTYGTATITATREITKNEDNEYSDTTTISMDADIPNEVTAKMNITLKTNIKVGNVSIPKVSSSDSVDINDEDALNEYITDATKKAEDLGKDLSEIKALEPFMENVTDAIEEATDSTTNSSSYSDYSSSDDETISPEDELNSLNDANAESIINY